MGSSSNSKSEGETRSKDHDRSEKRIGDLLIDAGLISDRQLGEALMNQERRGGKTVDQLIYLGHMDARQFVDFLAKQPGVPSISLKNCRISKELLELVPESFALKHELFPIDRLGHLLTVGMVCPLDSKAIKELEEMTGLKVKAMLCTEQEIRGAISEHYQHSYFTVKER